VAGLTVGAHLREARPHDGLVVALRGGYERCGDLLAVERRLVVEAVEAAELAGRLADQHAAALDEGEVIGRERAASEAREHGGGRVIEYRMPSFGVASDMAASSSLRQHQREQRKAD
jgi:hypothetical protein